MTMYNILIFVENYSNGAYSKSLGIVTIMDHVFLM